MLRYIKGELHMEIVLEIKQLLKNVSESLITPFDINKIIIEDRGCPHTHPEWKKGMKAIYTFNFQGVFLKIGKVGAKSQSRFIYKHYKRDSKNTNSSLAKSILEDNSVESISHIFKLNDTNVGAWILNNCQRIDIWMPDDEEFDLFTQNLIEAVLHYTYQPIYEGHNTQRKSK